MSYPTLDITTGDIDTEVVCPGCEKLILQVTNQPIYLTFGKFYGVARLAVYGQAEPYLPSIGSLARVFDAFKVRSKVPLASIPAGQNQAHVFLTPIPAGVAGI